MLSWQRWLMLILVAAEVWAAAPLPEPLQAGIAAVRAADPAALRPAQRIQAAILLVEPVLSPDAAAIAEARAILAGATELDAAGRLLEARAMLAAASQADDDRQAVTLLVPRLTLTDGRHVAALAEAGRILGDGALLTSAAEAIAPLVGAAEPENLTALAGGCLALHRATGDARWRDEAVRLHGLIPAPLDNARGALLRYQLGWITENAGWREEARTAATTAVAGTPTPRNASWYRTAAIIATETKPTVATPRRPARDSSRHVRVRAAPPTDAAPGAEMVIDVQVEIDEGWHIYANDLEDQFLIKTELTATPPAGFALIAVDYPASVGLDAGDGTTTPVYEGEFSIKVRLRAPDAAAEGVATLRLMVQACDNESCLPPARFSVDVPLTVR